MLLLGRRGCRVGAVALGWLGVMLSCRSPIEPRRPSLWTALDAHQWYTCGISVSSEAFCWGGTTGGYREDPPPPDSIPPNSAVPLRVPGGHRFVAIAVGEVFQCALDSLRAAYCWGRNDRGNLGDGTAWPWVAKRSPSAVVGGLRWQTLSAGILHACGIATDGRAYCWGNAFRGALGNGEYDGARSSPVAVVGGLTFATVHSGAATSCALTPEGEAYCWGVNDYGILGDGEPPEPFKESLTPSRVVGGLRFASLTVGGEQVCGIASDRRAYCWGGNRYGQLGNGTTMDTSTPTPVSGDLRWDSLSSGYFHVCGITTDGATYCWGSNNEGQFGTGTTGTASTPQLVAAAGTYVAITAGARHTCGRNAAGIAFCWGDGDYGQLGDGIFADRLYPVQVAAYE